MCGPVAGPEEGRVLSFIRQSLRFCAGSVFSFALWTLWLALAALLGFGLAAMLALPVLHEAIAAACGLALWLASSRQLGE